MWQVRPAASGRPANSSGQAATPSTTRFLGPSGSPGLRSEHVLRIEHAGRRKGDGRPGGCRFARPLESGVPSGDYPGTIRGASGDHPGSFFRLFFDFFSTFFRPSGDHPGTTRGSSGTPPGGGTPGPLTLIRTAGVMVSYEIKKCKVGARDRDNASTPK